MNFEFSNKVLELQNKLTNFMNENVYKNEEVFEDQLNKNGRWTIPPILEELKEKAKKEGKYTGGKNRIDRDEVKRLSDLGLGATAISKRMNIHRDSVYRLLKQAEA